jgi:hypothetical protein
MVDSQIDLTTARLQILRASKDKRERDAVMKALLGEIKSQDSTSLFVFKLTHRNLPLRDVVKEMIVALGHDSVKPLIDLYERSRSSDPNQMTPGAKTARQDAVELLGVIGERGGLGDMKQATIKMLDNAANSIGPDRETDQIVRGVVCSVLKSIRESEDHRKKVVKVGR